MDIDNYCGTVFGSLTVIGIAGKTNGGIRLYACHCSECAKDSELFGNAIFNSVKGSLVDGRRPCGCSKSPHWTASQYRILLSRKAAGKYSVIVPDDAGIRTKVQCTCTVVGCGQAWEARINTLLNSGCGCPSCATTGYDPSKSGTFYTYMWTNTEGKSFLKYGITNQPTKRIRQQSRSTEYKPIKLCSVKFTDGTIAINIEKRIDEYKKSNQIPSPVTKSDFPDGYTETLPISEWPFIANLVQSNTVAHSV